jgi:hypothetical protein
MKRYDAKPIVQMRRMGKAGLETMPVAACGIAIPVGWVLLPTGQYVRESEYVIEDYSLKYLQQRSA